MRSVTKTALGGIVAALSISLMFLISVIPLFTYAVPAAAAMLIIPIVIEINKKWAFGVYFSVSLLGLILVPNKEVAILYTAFFGYYPVIKAAIEIRFSFVPEWLIKLVLFNCTIAASYFLMLKFIGIKIDEFDKFGILAVPVLLVSGTVAFILYDYAMTQVIKLYILKFQLIFRKMFK